MNIVRMIAADIGGSAGRSENLWRAAWLALLLLFASVVSAANAQAASLAHVPKYAAILVDADTGEVLYSRSADASRAPASITKVMTLYLLFEALEAKELKPTDRIYFSANAVAQPPSKLGIARGGWITVEEAIRTLTTKSANDVAAAVAERLAGSELAFARKMTQRAQELGMRSTAFYNASGLPNPAHLSTARDLATLSRAMIRNYPQYYAYFSQQQYNFNGRVLANHNKLLGKFAGLDGIKTGYTNAAGFTLAASAVREGKRLVAVVLGAPTSASRNDNVAALLDAGFNVLRQRRYGHRSTVANSLFEMPDGLDINEAISEQGSSDDVSVWRKAIPADGRQK